MATNTKTNTYHLHLKGFVGGYDFDADYVDQIRGTGQSDQGDRSLIYFPIKKLAGERSTNLSR